ncbi:hypothetical protein [Actinomyces sp. ZJ308]|uniref:hypothetical protein n=1 Tax=Actinomyces sp. ZJ308 TaxID=2708342 RepID=UPI001422FA38|nr:hypothetical protein [Actinomyces sp. ZJ308]
MNRLRQLSPVRYLGRLRRSSRAREGKQPATHLIAVIAVTLAALPLSACSDGGGSIIRSWLLKQDGVEKVDVTHSNCTFLDGKDKCSTDVTINLSSNTSPDAVCSLTQKADEELPKKKRIGSHHASLTLTWQYRGTKMTLESHETPIANTASTNKDPSQECEMLNTAAEYAGEDVDEISTSSRRLEIYRGDVDKVPDNLFTRSPSPDKKSRTESWDHFTLNDWSVTTTASSTTTAPDSAAKDVITSISQTPGPTDRSKLLIFFQLGGAEGDDPESEITVGGLGGSPLVGPDTDAAAAVLASTMKQPEISKIKLCASSSKRSTSMDDCIVYTKKNGAIETDSEYFTGRTRDIYEAAKKLS